MIDLMKLRPEVRFEWMPENEKDYRAFLDTNDGLFARDRVFAFFQYGRLYVEVVFK